MEREMKVTFPGGMRVDAEYKGRVIQTDQPVYQGGGGEAPAPFDLFLASIATCRECLRCDENRKESGKKDDRKDHN